MAMPLTRSKGLSMLRTPQFKMRAQYIAFYANRFQHFGYERWVSKGFASSDREIGKGGWEIPMSEKQEPELIRVTAGIIGYIGSTSDQYIKIAAMDGNNLPEGNDIIVSKIEYLYWKRIKWKIMTFPFVNHFLKQAGLKL
jgi:hypothetical protein